MGDDATGYLEPFFMMCCLLFVVLVSFGLLLEHELEPLWPSHAKHRPGDVREGAKT